MAVQGTEAWRQDRCGKVTASRVIDVVKKIKSGAYSADRKNYLAELLVERLTGRPAAHFKSKAMDWGSEQEALARELYEFETGRLIETVGFVDHPLIPMAGASPDGLVGADGLVEFKCPESATHLETLLGAPIPEEYVIQMQWQLACTRRVWCDFTSFDPVMPDDMKRHTRRVQRDDVVIRHLEAEVRGFLMELDAKVAAVKATIRKDVAA